MYSYVYIYCKKKISGPSQFKLLLFKGQLYYKICDGTCFQVSALEIYVVYSFSSLVSFPVFTHSVVI